MLSSENSKEVLKSLLFVHDYQTRKTFKAIKIFDAAFRDDEKQNHFKKDLEKEPEFYKLKTIVSEDIAHTVLFEMIEDQSTIYYNNDFDLTSEMALKFLNELSLEITNIERSNFNNKDFLNSNEISRYNDEYRLDDIFDCYKKVSNDIHGSKEIYDKIKKQISLLDKEWQYFDFEFEYKGKVYNLNIPK